MAPRLNIPPVTRALLIALGIQSLLSAAIRCRQWSAETRVVIPYLTLVPALSLSYPWTLLTTTLVESNVFTAGISVFALYHGGRYLERAWSSEELIKFFAIVALCSNISTFFSLLAMRALTQTDSWTLTVICGTIPIQIGFLVAFSQLLPSHTVTLFRGIISLHVPRFPLIYVGIVALLSFLPLLSAAAFFLAVYGFFSSWTYLRFYKEIFPDMEASRNSSTRGDASESFAIAEFFPGPAKPIVRTISNTVFSILCAIHICTPFTAAEVTSATARHPASGIPNDGVSRGGPGARAEAERRRALALRVLDQRLQAATAAAQAKTTVTQPPVTGPAVTDQPSSSTVGMTSKPAEMLGQTNYHPESDSYRS